MADSPMAVIEGLVAPVREEASKLEARKVELAAEIAAINDQLRTLNRVLVAAGPKERRSAVKPRRGGKGGGVAQERVDLALEILRTMEAPLTASKLAEASKGRFTRVQATKVISRLRDDGQLRLTGWVKSPRQRGLGQKGYVLA